MAAKEKALGDDLRQSIEKAISYLNSRLGESERMMGKEETDKLTLRMRQAYVGLNKVPNVE